MLKIVCHSQFKRDYKLVQKRGCSLKLLRTPLHAQNQPASADRKSGAGASEFSSCACIVS
jgi:mRNA-degrading endonuclease YafQ of YafQ-DinJ toxin-antitoxin module